MNEDLPQAAIGRLALFDELLKRPDEAWERSNRPGAARRSAWLAAGGVAGIALYAAVGGLFGGDVALPLWKGPLIVVFSVALCVPSLYVLSALVGVDLPRRRFVGAVAGFLAMLGLLLVALLPVAWLFSVASRSLVSVVWLHVVVWGLVVTLACRYLGRLFPARPGLRFLWTLLLVAVSLQATTYLRPILVREPGAGLFEAKRLFFFEHLGEIGDAEAKARRDAQANTNATR